MIPFIRRSVGVAVGLIGVLFVAPWPARSCGEIDPIYYAGTTYVTAERAVIIWDDANKVEHFVRQANFETGSPEIGFLVPTPETPELSEVDPRFFDLVDAVGAARPVAPVSKFTPWAPLATVLGIPGEIAGGRSYRSINVVATPAAAAPVGPHRSAQVLFEKDVAGYHATTLPTEDYDAVAAWLTANGFAPKPEFKAWLQAYGRAHWKITAFKLNNTDTTYKSLTTRAVRLSFHTNQPYYPYSEPSDRQKAAAASPQGRALHVAVLSNRRVAGTLANGTPWAGKLEFAGPAAPEKLTLSNGTSGDTFENAPVATQWIDYANLKTSQFKTAIPSVLTTFLDESNPRPGTADLDFTPAPDQSGFIGTRVDYSMNPTRQLDLTQPLPDFAALLFIMLVCGSPVWCGSRALFLARLRRAPVEAGEPRSPLWMVVVDRLAGSVTVLIGCLGLVFTGLAMVSGVFLLFEFPPGAVVVMVLALAGFLISLKTSKCGMRIARSKYNPAPVDPVPVPAMELPTRPEKRHRQDRRMGAAAVATGALLIVGLVMLFVANASA